MLYAPPGDRLLGHYGRWRFVIYILEVRSLKWDGMVAFFLEALGESPFSCIFKFLDATHIPWLMAPSLTHISFSDSKSPAFFFSITWTLMITLDPPGQPRILSSLKTLNLSYQQRPLCHII